MVMTATQTNFTDKKLTILHKEIDLIQAIITRMARNSFYIKGWGITVATAVFSFAWTQESAMAIVLPMIMLMVAILVFWSLDAYYLREERLYRIFYNQIIKARIKKNKWENLYSLDASNCKSEVQSIPRIMFSKSEILYPTLCLFIILGVFFNLRYGPPKDVNNSYIESIHQKLNTSQIEKICLRTTQPVQDNYFNCKCTCIEKSHKHFHHQFIATNTINSFFHKEGFIVHHT